MKMASNVAQQFSDYRVATHKIIATLQQQLADAIAKEKEATDKLAEIQSFQAEHDELSAAIDAARYELPATVTSADNSPPATFTTTK